MASYKWESCSIHVSLQTPQFRRVDFMCNVLVSTILTADSGTQLDSLSGWLFMINRKLIDIEASNAV